MRTAEFVAEFEDDQFPDEIGPVVRFDDHDPQFTQTELRKMERQQIIIVDWPNRCYRLTLKATAIAQAAARLKVRSNV